MGQVERHRTESRSGGPTPSTQPGTLAHPVRHGPTTGLSNHQEPRATGAQLVETPPISHSDAMGGAIQERGLEGGPEASDDHPANLRGLAYCDTVAPLPVSPEWTPASVLKADDVPGGEDAVAEI